MFFVQKHLLRLRPILRENICVRDSARNNFFWERTVFRDWRLQCPRMYFIAYALAYLLAERSVIHNPMSLISLLSQRPRHSASGVIHSPGAEIERSCYHITRRTMFQTVTRSQRRATSVAGLLNRGKENADGQIFASGQRSQRGSFAAHTARPWSIKR